MPEPMSTAVAHPSAAKVKGTLFLARMKFLRARGKEQCDLVLARLPSADRTLLEGVLLPSSWYPAELLARLEAAIAAVLARGDRKVLFAELGRFSADVNLRGVQRPYLREGDPHHILSCVPRMYLSQHGSGVRTYRKTGDKAAAITSVCESPSPDECLTAIGWLQRAVELSGGRDVKVTEPRCRARGAEECEYVVTWDGP